MAKKQVQIKNRVLKMEPIKWKEAQWLQTTLKELLEADNEKLKRSLVDNDFSMPFHVWLEEKTKTIWILDGHHRQKAMQELEENGVVIPEKLPAVFIRCKTKKEAAKLVVVYSSIYAGVTSEGLVEFLKENELDWGDLRDQVVIPGINLDYFFDPPEALPNVDVGGEKTTVVEYLIVTFETMEQYQEAKEKLGMKGLTRTIPFTELSEKWDF